MSFAITKILSKVTAILTAVETATGMTITPKTLSADNDTVEAGYYEATTLSTVDADLAADNIKSGVTIFGIVGAADIQDIDAADLTVGEAPTGKTFFAVSGGIKTGTGTKTLTDDNETVAAGYYAATTLSAVDAHLASANIKSGVSVFGKAGAATVQEIGAADLTVGEAPTGKTFFATTGGIKTGTGTKTLSDANDTVEAGYYAATTLSAVDTDLAAANIKSGVTIFGKAGAATVQEIGAADAAVGDVLVDKTFFSVTGAIKTGTAAAGANVDGVDGELVMTIPDGHYTGSKTATAADTLLVVGNIKAGVTVFGVAGTYETPITGDAAVGDVLDGKLFYADDATTQLEGTLALTGDAEVGDVLDGVFFYKDDAKTKLEGTLALTGDAVVADVKDGVFFYADDAKTKLEGTMPTVALAPASGDYPAGYHAGDAGGLVAIEADLVPSKIKAGETIFGVLGEYGPTFTGDAVAAEVLDGKFFYSDDPDVKIEGTMPTVALDPASGAYPAGYHAGDVGGLVAIEADLVEGKIKAGTTIFGVLGIYETVLTGDAAVADVKDGKFFYANDGTTQLEGTMLTVSLNPAQNAYPAGYHAGDASLTAVEASLITANIKTGITIFGVNGSANVVDTTEESDAATAADIADGKFAWVNGVRLEGTHV